MFYDSFKYAPDVLTALHGNNDLTSYDVWDILDTSDDDLMLTLSEVDTSLDILVQCGFAECDNEKPFYYNIQEKGILACEFFREDETLKKSFVMSLLVSFEP